MTLEPLFPTLPGTCFGGGLRRALNFGRLRATADGPVRVEYYTTRRGFIVVTRVRATR